MDVDVCPLASSGVPVCVRGYKDQRGALRLLPPSRPLQALWCRTSLAPVMFVKFFTSVVIAMDT